MIDWQSFPVTRRADGSYVIVYNGLPYHVPDSGKWRDLWVEVDAYAQAHPEQASSTRSTRARVRPRACISAMTVLISRISPTAPMLPR